MNEPITISCLAIALEKQIVLRTSRLRCERRVRRLRSMCCVIAFVGAVDFGDEVPSVGPSRVWIIAREAEGLEQSLQLQKHLVLTSTKDIGQDLPGVMIEGMPEPPWFLLLPDKAPHFVPFGFVHTLQDDPDLARGQASNEGTIHR